MKSVRDYLQDFLDYLGYVADFTTGGRETFMLDRKTQLAVIRAYEVIGEIAKRLPESLRQANPQKPFEKW